VASQRYIAADKFSFIGIPSMSGTAHLEEARLIYDMHMRNQQHVYSQLRDLGVPKEDARMVLGQGTTTEFIMTANFREWRHIINLRCNKEAQWEIREVMKEVLRQLYGIAPAVFGDLQEKFSG
jgi:thymidylate synthase (FAD)